MAGGCTYVSFKYENLILCFVDDVNMEKSRCLVAECGCEGEKQVSGGWVWLCLCECRWGWHRTLSVSCCVRPTSSPCLSSWHRNRPATSLTKSDTTTTSICKLSLHFTGWGSQTQLLCPSVSCHFTGWSSQTQLLCPSVSCHFTGWGSQAQLLCPSVSYWHNCCVYL